MKRLLIPLIIAVLMCLTLTAVATADGITFDTTVDSINEGETLQTVLTREGETADGEVTYTSSDPKVATVDANGLVTGVKKGRVTITAAVKGTAKTYKATLKLTIVRPVTSVTVNTDKLSLYSATDEKVAASLSIRENAEENELPVLLLPVKKSQQLAVTTEPRDATNRNVTVESSDPAVFTAKQTTITGVAPGEGIVTIASASNPEVSVRYRVLVVQPVTKLTAEASAPSVNVGGQVTVTAKALPENATMKAVIWSSGDERIATVDANGTVTGIKRGNGRIIATAADGSNVRANINVKVVQNPESITLSSEEATVDVGKNIPMKATVLPKESDNKKVIWTSSDESIAKVGKDGRITGVSVGECTVTCTSEAVEGVFASVTVHVQQPVKKLSYNTKDAICYVDETVQLSWTVEPANATNPKIAFSSANTKIATVDENGVVTGVKGGTVKINAVTTDGSNRKAQITVKVGSHVKGVHMVRKHAYLDLKETATAGAELEPKDALDNRMIWSSSDESVVTARGDINKKMKLTAVGYGTATVTGVTVDGNFEATLPVTVGDFDKGINFQSFDYDQKGNFWLKVKNNTNVTITEIKAILYMCNATDGENSPVPINTKDGSNHVEIRWKGTLEPGATTTKNNWKMINYKLPDWIGIDDTRGSITLETYVIDNDWVKNIRNRTRVTLDY